MHLLVNDDVLHVLRIEVELEGTEAQALARQPRAIVCLVPRFAAVAHGY